MKNVRQRTDSTDSDHSDSRSRDGNKKNKRSRSRSPGNDYDMGTNSRDPKMVASRIFVGNLPTVAGLKREDVRDIFKKYGKITGLLLMNGYGFVQFDNEESANRSKLENGLNIRGHAIEVRVANERRKSNGPMFCESILTYPAGFISPLTTGYPPNLYPSIPRPATMAPMDFYKPPVIPFKSKSQIEMALDCEIILVDERQRVYGELVLKRLLGAGLMVEIKELPFDSNTLTMVDLASMRGTLFVIIINEQNELHRSITVNILYGSPQEHRNMPLEDALTLITRKFDKYVTTKKERLTSSFDPPGPHVAYLLNLIADGRYLSIQELDVVVEYLNERKMALLKSEEFNMKSPNLSSSHLQGHVTPDEGHLKFNDLPANTDEKAKNLSSVFDNPLIQRALDNLFTKGPNILNAVPMPQSNENSTNCLFPSAPNISQNLLGFSDNFDLPQRSVNNQPITGVHCPNLKRNQKTNNSTDMSWLAYAGN